MKMTSLKLPRKTKKEMSKEMAVPSTEDMPEYPWGLQLRFDKDIISKLPYLEGVGAGQECTFMAKGYVKEVSVDASGKTKKRQSVEIQVTDIGFGDGKKRLQDLDMKEYAKERGKSYA